uniref:Uncharacterized protein n=1 Tax=Gloeothece verrucosa (strain PCC 7822) TaxID=497965 RepID=E0UAJ8_GLOV7|nr:hypothetical protein Cyan7822_0707 [Gloeothece verrucosa PCC 7822]
MYNFLLIIDCYLEVKTSHAQGEGKKEKIFFLVLIFVINQEVISTSL